jgi:hypothetical protein
LKQVDLGIGLFSNTAFKAVIVMTFTFLIT